MGINFSIYSIDTKNMRLQEVLSLSGQKAMLLANWFYTFYHKQNQNYLAEAETYIAFYIEELHTILSHIEGALTGKTFLMPVYDCTLDDLLYLEAGDDRYNMLLKELHTDILQLCDAHTEDMLYTYNIEW